MKTYPFSETLRRTSGLDTIALQFWQVWTVLLRIVQIPQREKHPRPVVLNTPDYSVICVVSNLFSIWCMHTYILPNTEYTQLTPPDFYSISFLPSLNWASMCPTSACYSAVSEERCRLSVPINKH